MGDTKTDIDTSGFRLIRTRQIIGFVCVFVLVYGLLLIPWPGLRTAYSKLYRTAAALLFESSGADWKVVFQELNAPEHDMRIVFYSLNQTRTGQKTTPVGYIKHNSHRGGYICTTFLIALILATPVSWKRRGWAMLYGMLLIHVFIALKVGILLLYGFNKEPFSVIVLSPFWSRALSLAYHVFIPNLTFSLIVSVFIWILVSFRRDDWAKLLMGRDSSSRVKAKKMTCNSE